MLVRIDPPYKRRRRERIRKRREEWLIKNGPCVRCGSDQNLEVDHINPAEKVTTIRWGMSEERRNIELSKCQVLCRKCHREKTNKDFGWKEHSPHGSTRYRWGCRCDVCTEANRLKNREYKKKKLQKESLNCL